MEDEGVWHERTSKAYSGTVQMANTQGGQLLMELAIRWSNLHFSLGASLNKTFRGGFWLVLQGKNKKPVDVLVFLHCPEINVLPLVLMLRRR